MPIKDPLLDLAKLYYSADGGKTFQPFDGLKPVEITEKIIDYRDKNDLLPSCWPAAPLSFSGCIQMTKQQKKKFRKSWKRLTNQINRDHRRVKRYKEAMRRLRLKMGG